MSNKPNQRKAYTAHYKRVERYAALLDSIYASCAGEFSKLASSVGHDPNKAFQWSDYPQAKRKVDQLLRGMAANIQGVVVNGVTAEWGESNFKNDRLARAVIGVRQFDKDDKGQDKIPERFKPYFNNNAAALQSFVGRKQKGLGLSQKVWKLTEQYKTDLELALSVGLSDGKSAAELSRDIRAYLKEPTKLFRRIRNEKGDLQLSQAAKAYHPGAGTYRSSYKNAMRLTRTEVNMAYRTADSERYKQLDFVVGFEVKRSGRGYDCSVCESLAGKYPKDFKFTGWHPHCRCYVIPILKTDEEFWAWDGRGEAPTSSVNEVRDVPSGYNNFILDNGDRIAKAEKNGTLPYFIRNNDIYVRKATKNSKNGQLLLGYFKVNKAELTVPLDRLTFAREMRLTPVEMLAITEYTENGYKALNSALRRGGELSQCHCAMRDAINSGLEKLEIFDGVSFRGSRLSKSNIDKYRRALKTNTLITEMGYTSTTLDFDTMLSYAGNVCFEIKSKKGRYLDLISYFYAEEYEILYKEGSKFRVLDVLEYKITDSFIVTKIVMEEH